MNKINSHLIEIKDGTILIDERFLITGHALKRAVELGYTTEDIISAFLYSDKSYQSKDGWIYTKNDVAIAVDEDREVVLSVLIKTSENWQHGTHHRFSFKE